jgi:phage terminase small subunit
MSTHISKYLPRNTQKQGEREYTERQLSFLANLLKTGGDPKQAAELAGYSEGSYPQVIKALKQEMIDLASDVLAQSAPKAAFKLVEVMEAEHSIPQSNVKIQAAQTILDRIGLGKAERIDVNHKVDDSNQGSLFILPAKTPVTVDDAEYAVSKD